MLASGFTILGITLSFGFENLDFVYRICFATLKSIGNQNTHFQLFESEGHKKNNLLILVRQLSTSRLKYEG